MKKNLKIFGHKYNIVYDKNLTHRHDVSALYCSSTLEIFIDSSLKESKKEECLIHEIIEALNYHMEMELPHPKIMQLGEGLYQVLKDNKMLRDL